ncbi:MAG: tRNA (adenosine(37)-N6)-dimethylallyltransferase MiaA [Haliangiales bacterium]
MIVGPTAAGKSKIALELAVRANAEIVSADSQQVYIGMDIGTAKVSPEERAQARHHLIDVLPPHEQMTVAHFVELADRAIRDATERGKAVVVAGGTGFYVRALLLGIFDGPSADPALRQRLQAQAAEGGGIDELWRQLQTVDPELATRLDRNDVRRVIRALEVYELTGTPLSVYQARHNFRTLPTRYPVRMIGLAPEREVLHRRIDARVDAMMSAGFLAEVETLRACGIRADHCSQTAIGYSQLHQHLDGAFTLDKAVVRIKQSSRRYARRQRSWYRGDARVRWHQHASDVDLDDLERYLRARA